MAFRGARHTRPSDVLVRLETQAIGFALAELPA